ncbi:general substrate transporter [Phaffia rhodozyma]|uniref:General substrate transporter n=1 Tax=Phaffia rhodozyma TaxID=264483 RepID=A0A0F7SNS4_PHARH|nr:general substrate transporter [Phaffia rhodozyma]
MSQESSTPGITLNIKGPSELKLSISISPEATVADLKSEIAQKSEVEANRQRLIYSGKVLKDEETLATYKLATGHTVHMVKGAPRAGDAGASSGGASAAATSTTPTGASAFGLPASGAGTGGQQRLPTMAAGQQVVGNPLAALEGVQGHGFGGGIFNPFEGMGNLNDPNAMANMARSPAMMEQITHMLENPEFVDQIINSDPRLSAMGPQMRQMLQSPMFRQMLSNPDMMRQMMQMQQMMGGGAGGGFGGLGGAGAGTAFPPPGAFGQPPSTESDSTATSNLFGGAAPGAGTGAGTAGGNMFGGLPMPTPEQMQNMMGMLGGGAGGAGPGVGLFGQGFGTSAPQDTRPAHERFADQLVQLQHMGFYDGQKNIEALSATGGNVSAAVEYLFIFRSYHLQSTSSVLAANLVKQLNYLSVFAENGRDQVFDVVREREGEKRQRMTHSKAKKPGIPVVSHNLTPDTASDALSTSATQLGGEFIDDRGRRVYRTTTVAPTEPSWSKYIPGGYNRKWQIPLKGKAMMWGIQGISGLAILFYGYDQGVMSGVNNSTSYKVLMGTASDPETQRDSAAIGGIVAIYYLGTLFGGLMGGILGDSIGRIKTIEIACVFAIIGASLQASTQNITWMIFARIITGLGTGSLNAVVPVLSSELSTHDARGAVLGFEFFLNIMGLAVAYWLEFGLKWASNRSEQFSWRFPLAFQLVFLLIILFTISLFPESPRWLAKMGREEEARHILAVCRTPDADEDDLKVSAELYEIMEVVEVERQSTHLNSYWAMFFGSDSYHLKRRTWLIIWLQIMQELVGIGVITVYAPTVFQQAGYSEYKSDLLSGCNDIAYMLSVLIAVFTLDRIGRRVTLYWGAIVMGISLILAGVAAKYVTKTDGSQQAAYGAVVATFVFVYTSTFGATWLTVPWLYPTEITPNFIRAKGGAVSVFGWSIGNGIVTEITPFLFNAIGFWTFILFAVLNFCTLPFIYYWYPETAGRSLEEMDILFSADSILVHKQEKDLKRIAETDPELYHAMALGDKKAIQRKQSYKNPGAVENTRFTEHAGNVKPSA